MHTFVKKYKFLKLIQEEIGFFFQIINSWVYNNKFE